MSALTNVPGLAGYLEAQQQNEARSAGDLQKVATMQGILAQLQKQKQDEQLRATMAQSGGDVEKALEIALRSGNVAAAHQLAPLVESKRKERERQMLSGGNMNDPAFLRNAGLALGKPEFVTHAERLEKVAQDEATLRSMQSVPARTIQPDQQEVAQAADQGTPPVQAATAPGRAGVFASLMQSELPAIASAAKNYQAQMDSASARSISPQHWLDLQKQLQAQEATQLNMRAMQASKPTSERLVPVKEADGRIVYLPASEARGREVGGRVTDVNLPKQVQQLGRDLEKAGLNTMAPVVERARAITPDVAEYITGPKSLLPDRAVPQSIRDARQDLQRLFNITLKDRSGAAVTNQELDRLKQEFGSGVFKTGSQLISAIGRAREIIDSHYAGVASSYGPDVLAEYNKNREAIGGAPFQMRPRATPSSQTQPGAPQAQQSGIPQVKDEAEYNALPSGAVYIAPDGKTKRKR